MLTVPRNFLASCPDNLLLPRLHRLVRGLALLLLLSAFPVTAEAVTLYVSAGGNFQAALNAAQPGDTIVLEAGATFVGPFTLPFKPGTNTDADYITITSSRAAELPAADARITPAFAHLLPKLVTPGRGDWVLQTAPRAHHYRLVGIEFGLATPDALAYDLIHLGDGSRRQSDYADVPHHLVIDRCYIHGNATMDLKRGIALNSAHTEILNSYISDFHVTGQEAQAIAGWNGPGPFKIINNYLEGAGENLIFGGSQGGLANLIPSDIEIRRNHFYKPVGWRAQRWTVKNILELKNARRVVIDGNLFENNWVNAQSGYAILFTPRPNDSGPAAVVEDVEFTNNIVRNTAAGLSLHGQDYLYTAGPTERRLHRVRIANNLFTGIDGAAWGGGHGSFLLLAGATDAVTVEHNTVVQTGSAALVGPPTHTGFSFRHNIVRHNEYGIKGDGLNPGNSTLEGLFTAPQVLGNALIGVGPPPFGPFYEPLRWYPSGNHFPRTEAEIGFVDAAGGDYRLREDSPYKRAGSVGQDLGCDFAQLAAAQAGGVARPLPTPTSTPTSTPTPTPLPTPISTPQLNGYHDAADCNVIAGWAWNASNPHTPTSVDIYADGQLIGTVVADQFRQDLLDAGIGNGWHSFTLETPAILRDGQPHLINVRFAGTPTDLNTTYKTLACTAEPTSITELSAGQPNDDFSDDRQNVTKQNQAPLNESGAAWGPRLAVREPNAGFEIMPLASGGMDNNGLWLAGWDMTTSDSLEWRLLTPQLFKLRC